MSFIPYIKDMGINPPRIRPYGTNCHDSLEISPDGRTLSYYNLQNGEGSKYGDYRFCDDEGHTPEEDEVLIRHGANAYFNIGGFISNDDEEILNLYYGMSESMQKAIKDIMIVTQEKKENVTESTPRQKEE